MPLDNEIEQKKQRILINKIVETILRDKFFAEDWSERLAYLEEFYSGEATKDREILKEGLIEHFKNKSIIELEKYYASISIRVKKDIDQPFKIETFKDFFKPFVDMFKQLFQGENGGFLGQLMEGFHNLQVTINPGVLLNKNGEQSSKYSKWFSDFGYNGRELYRKSLKAEYTEKQKLDVLLAKMKKDEWSEKKDSLELLEFAEKEVLVNNKVNGIIIADQVVEIVKSNLEFAAQKSGIYVPVPADGVDYDQWDDNYKAFYNIYKTVEQLVEKINEQKTILTSDEVKTLSIVEKQEIYKTMQNDRIKLLHFIEKTNALGKEEIFSVKEEKRGLTFEQYFRKQIDKFKYISATGVLLPNEPNGKTQPKSLLKSFVDGNRSSVLVCKEKFDKAIIEVKQKRFEEIKIQKEELKNNFEIFFIAQSMINIGNVGIKQKLEYFQGIFNTEIDQIPDIIDNFNTLSLDQIKEYKKQLDRLSQVGSLVKEEFTMNRRRTTGTVPQQR